MGQVVHFHDDRMATQSTLGIVLDLKRLVMRIEA